MLLTSMPFAGFVCLKDSEAYAIARDRYVGKFPSSRPTFGLGDFNLYVLSLVKGRCVIGFARTLSLTASRFTALADSADES
jgi:hypothetical protein